ncbi:S-layer homology domain-containing protein [Cohnella thailandensis]|uniref:FIVAR domain-containing protein n=1 Tax=Cohnella thailandensis TaxID=557557 RepID=A0A841SZX1_9BACL|nr:S-layer homology domain-containing protein [Cohnella thailandensis]MBB6635805.1 FIVAR domain-containing protein [Cohnella thailandensis]MBP1976183.1 hypothetical protein [Cohnella thailandensis]
MNGMGKNRYARRLRRRRTLLIALAWVMAATLAAYAGPSRASAAVGNATFVSSTPADGAYVNQFSRLEAAWSDPLGDEFHNGGYLLRRVNDGKYMQFSTDPNEVWNGNADSWLTLRIDTGGRYHLDLEPWQHEPLQQDGAYEITFFANDYDGITENSNFHTIRFTLDRIAPGLSNAVINKEYLTFDLSEQPDGKSWQTTDFDVRVNDVSVPLEYVAPDSNSNSDMISIKLITAVTKEDAVTVAYAGSSFADAAGNSVITDPVSASNVTPGSFQEPPAMPFRMQAGYTLKAGEPIVRFTPSSSGATEILFTPPNEPGNPPTVNTAAIRKTDFVLRDLVSEEAFIPATAWGTNDAEINVYRIYWGLPLGVTLQKGHTYELAFSDTAGGNELTLPLNPTTEASAYFSLEHSAVLMDEYSFADLGIPAAPPVDKSRLTDTVNDAQAEHDAAEEGEAHGQYTADSKAALQTAIDEAAAILDDGGATQEEVDAAAAELEEALEEFFSKMVVVDTSSLEEAIDEAQALYDAAVEGPGDGHFPEGAKEELQTAILAAWGVLDSRESTQAQVDAASSDLGLAIAAFESQRIVVDKTQLTNAINEAQDEHDAAVEGEANGQYAAGAKAALQEVINAARVAFNYAGSTQAEVDEALADLEDALAEFYSKRVIVDFSELRTWIGTAQAKYAAAVEGEANGQYAAGAKADLQAAINAAQDVLDDTGATQAEVNAALTALEEAIAAFEAKKVAVNLTELTNAIREAQDEHDAAEEGEANGQYAVGARADLRAAIDAAQDVLDDAGATQAEVDEALSALEAALVEFYSRVVVVNTSTLEEAVEEAQSLFDAAVEGSGNGQFPEGTKEELRAAILAAWAVLDSRESTQAQVDAAVTDLRLAIAAFESKQIVVEKNQLTNAIREAQDEHDAAVEGEANGQYATGAKAALQEAIDAAQDVLDDAGATQAKVDEAVSALEAALAEFYSKQVFVDTSSLEDKVEEAQSLFDAAVEGTGNGQFPEGTKEELRAAILAAWAVLDRRDSTQAQVDAAVTDLRLAIAAFESKQIVVEKYQLTNAIREAQDEHDAAEEGEANGQYAVGAKADLQAAINAAQDVLDDTGATQAKVDEAVSALEAALDEFYSRVIVVNTSTLEAAVEEAQSLFDAAVEGSGNGQYPEEAKRELHTAILAAWAVLDSRESTQAQVNAAVSNLEQAVALFESKRVVVDLTALTNAAHEAQAEHDAAVEGEANGQYTAGAKAALQASIDKAAALLDDPGATQAEVDEAVTILQEALTAFHAKKVNVDFFELRTLIESAQAKHDAALEGTANGQYEAGAKAALQAAIDDAATVKDRADSTQAQAAAAVAALKAALDAFEAKKVTVSVTPGGGGGGVSIPASSATYTLEVSLGQGVMGQLLVKQTKNSDGSIKDSLELTDNFIELAAKRLQEAGQQRLTIELTDKLTAASDYAFQLSSQASAWLEAAGIALDIRTPAANVLVPSASVPGSNAPLTIEISTVQDLSDQAAIEQRAERSAEVRNKAGNGEVSLIGRPVRIVTNLKGIPLTIGMPLTGQTGTDDIGLYMELEDGTVQLVQGLGSELLPSASGTFAIVNIAGWSDIGKAQEAEWTLQSLPYMSGYAGGLFKPNANVTRAEMAAILSRIITGKAASETFSFTDVPAWASDAIRLVAGLGIMSGSPNGNFRSDKPITRAEMATILSRLLPYAAVDNEPASASAGFTDTAGHWAEALIRQAQAAGFMKGFADGSFKPNQALSRAETVAILNKLIGLTAGSGEAPLYTDVPQAHWAYKDIQAAARS